jgi:hypothetical protein
LNALTSAESRIVSQLADHASKRACRYVIRQMRSIEAGLSGDDSGLKDAWDEVCVQVQFEQSFEWEAYEATLCQFIQAHLRTLPEYWREAIWLQTEAGSDWLCERDDAADEPGTSARPSPKWNDSPPVELSDLVEYVCREYVLDAAGRWPNRRIREYLDVGEIDT